MQDTESPGADIWVVVEHGTGDPWEVTFEMLAEARRLALPMGTSVAAVALGSNLQALPVALASYGADLVLLAEAPCLETYTTDAYVSVLESLVRARSPRLLLIADSPNGGDLAPRLAARLGVGLATGCTRLDVDADGRFHAIRRVYRQLQATVRLGPAQPAMATLRPGAFGVDRPQSGRRPSTEMVAVDVGSCAGRTRVLGVLEPDPATVDLSEAEIVVAGGRGIAGQAGWHLVEQLAAALGGAVGGTRVSADLGCIPLERVVGQSGRIIAPRLYVAAGISGASQHTSGLRDARCIVAINTDRGAPIVRMADLALLGDARQVLPVATGLVQRERRRAGQEADKGGTPP